MKEGKQVILKLNWQIQIIWLKKNLNDQNEKQEKENKDILKEIEILDNVLEAEKIKVFKLTNQDRIMCLGSSTREWM